MSAPPGAIAECGSYQAGSGAVLASADSSRDVWLFDSWEGCPPPGSNDIDRDGIAGVAGQFSGSEERAREIMRALDIRNVHLVRGWFEETLPKTKAMIGPIALLHIDADWYASTKMCLEELYAQVVEGGIVVIDDYGTWSGCKKATDEWAAARGLRMRRFDDTEVWLTKPAAAR